MNPFRVSDKVVCVGIPIDHDAPPLVLARVYVIEEVGDGWVAIVGLGQTPDGIYHCFMNRYFRKLDNMKSDAQTRLRESLPVHQ